MRASILRTTVALVLGAIGVSAIVAAVVVVVVSDHSPVDLSSLRYVLTIIVGALLVLAGVLTFHLPAHGGADTTGNGNG